MRGIGALVPYPASQGPVLTTDKQVGNHDVPIDLMKLHQKLVHGFPQRVDSVCVAMVGPKTPFPGEPDKLEVLLHL